MIRVVLAVFCLCLAAPEARAAEPVRIFAAASLKSVLDRITAERDLDVSIAYGGSAAIARQVAQGAQADIVILAHSDWMDWLDGQTGTQLQGRCDLTGNRLVVAGPSDLAEFTVQSPDDFITRLKGTRIASGHLKSVPSGQYAAAFLAAQGWLDALRPHLVETSNVRLALALVALGEARLGFVYASDVAAEPAVKTVYVPPVETYPAIRYPAAVRAGASPETRAVWSALTHSAETFAAAGFSPLAANDAARCQE